MASAAPAFSLMALLSVKVEPVKTDTPASMYTDRPRPQNARNAIVSDQDDEEEE